MQLSGYKLTSIRYALDLGVHQFSEFCNVCPRTLSRLVKGEQVHPNTCREVLEVLVKYEFVPLAEVECLFREWLLLCLGCKYMIQIIEEQGPLLRASIQRARTEYAKNEPLDYKLMKEKYYRPVRKKQTRKKRSKLTKLTDGQSIEPQDGIQPSVGSLNVESQDGIQPSVGSPNVESQDGIQPSVGSPNVEPQDGVQPSIESSSVENLKGAQPSVNQRPEENLRGEDSAAPNKIDIEDKTDRKKEE